MYPAKIVVLASMAAIGLATSAVGQDVQPDVIKSLGACTTITDDVARLHCFDVAANKLNIAISQDKITVLDQEGIRNRKRSLFGFALPERSLFGRADTAATPAPIEINSSIRQLVSIGNGKYELALDDDARWQTTESAMSAPLVGSKVRIKRGALGSYFMFLEGQRPIRARRIR